MYRPKGHSLMHLFVKKSYGKLIIFAGWDPKLELLKSVLCSFLSFFPISRYSLFFSLNHFNHLTLFSFFYSAGFSLLSWIKLNVIMTDVSNSSVLTISGILLLILGRPYIVSLKTDIDVFRDIERDQWHEMG